MRILHLADGLELAAGGTTEALYQLCRVARAQGHQVTVLATEQPGPSARQRLQELGVVVHTYPCYAGNFRAAPGMFAAAAFGLGPFDAVHAHGLWRATSGAAVLAARTLGVGRLVLSPHGQLDEWSYGQRTWKKRPALKMLLALIGGLPVTWHVTCDNEAAAVNKRVNWGQVQVVPMCVQPPGHAHQPRPERRLRVIFLGRLHPVKHVHTIVEACARLQRIGGLERLWLVGDGDAEPAYSARLRRQVRDRGLEHFVTFKGLLFGDDKDRALAQADVLVLPSAVESFGFAAAEAAAAGLPAIVSDQVGIQKDFERSGAGLVVHPGDAQGLFEALESLTNPDRRRACAMAASSLAQARYSDAAMGEALQRMYCRV